MLSYITLPSTPLAPSFFASGAPLQLSEGTFSMQSGCSTLSARSTPRWPSNPWFEVFSVHGVDHILEFKVFSVHGAPQVLEFARIFGARSPPHPCFQCNKALTSRNLQHFHSVNAMPHTLEFAAFRARSCPHPGIYSISLHRVPQIPYSAFITRGFFVPRSWASQGQRQWWATAHHPHEKGTCITTCFKNIPAKLQLALVLKIIMKTQDIALA